jgi:hypothetical protein
MLDYGHWKLNNKNYPIIVDIHKATPATIYTSQTSYIHDIDIANAQA